MEYNVDLLYVVTVDDTKFICKKTKNDYKEILTKTHIDNNKITHVERYNRYYSPLCFDLENNTPLTVTKEEILKKYITINQKLENNTKRKIILPKRNNDTLLYPVKSKIECTRMDTLDLWIKFLSHLKKEEKNILQKENLTIEESELKVKVKENLEKAELFKKYKQKQCTKEEHDKVLEFMNDNLEKTMIDRLEQDELQYAESMIKIFISDELGDLESVIEDKLSNYKTENIVNNYILYKLLEYNYNHIAEETTKKIVQEKKERTSNLVKSYIKDFGCNF